MNKVSAVQLHALKIIQNKGEIKGFRFSDKVPWGCPSTLQKMMADEEKHERIIASNTKWREWAKENDSMYRVRKAEAQTRWRAKQKCRQ